MSCELRLLEFMMTGCFAGIEPGMSKQKIIEIIGKPLGWAKGDSDIDEPDFHQANMWGYGNWVLFFEGDILNAITGSDLNNKEREFAEFENRSNLKFERMTLEEVIEFFESKDINYYRAPKKIKYINKSNMSISTKRRRLSCETVYVGDNLMARITFTDELKISQIAYPCSVISQVIGLEVNNRWMKKEIELLR